MESLAPILQWTEYLTLATLIALSVWSVGVMVDRFRTYRQTIKTDHASEIETLIRNQDSQKLESTLVDRQDLIAGLIKALKSVPQQKDNLEAASNAYLQTQKKGLEKGLSLLATLGSNAPFIGLFGTVLGIIEAFSVLATGQPGQGASDAVLASIAEALLATAAGLFVAIPAVVAYNYFSSRQVQALDLCDGLKNLYLAHSLKN